MKNFDSVPQLQRFSYVHQCTARSRHGSHSRHCRHSLLQRQLAALLQCGPAGHGFSGLVQQLQDQSPEPLVWTVERVSNRAVNRIELNRIDSFVALNRIESNFSFLPNRSSLIICLNSFVLIRQGAPTLHNRISETSNHHKQQAHPHNSHFWTWPPFWP